MENSFLELLTSATQMLLDHHEKERELIYAIACLDNEERAAIIMAYRNINVEENENDGMD